MFAEAVYTLIINNETANNFSKEFKMITTIIIAILSTILYSSRTNTGISATATVIITALVAGAVPVFTYTVEIISLIIYSSSL